MMVFHWCLSDSKSPQVSRTLLSILADHNNVVVWMVSTRPLISKSSSHLTNPLLIVPRAPITIGITVTFMLDSFFQFSKHWYQKLAKMMIIIIIIIIIANVDYAVTEMKQSITL